MFLLMRSYGCLLDPALGHLQSLVVREKIMHQGRAHAGANFKSHVDTPRSKDMFGSLVVCLAQEPRSTGHSPSGRSSSTTTHSALATLEH